MRIHNELYDLENTPSGVSRLCVICGEVIVAYPRPASDLNAADLAYFYSSIDDQVKVHLKSHTLGDAIARIRTLRKALGEVRAG